MSGKKLDRIMIPVDRLQGLLTRAKLVLAEEDFETLRDVVGTLSKLTELLEQKGTTIRRLKQMVFGATTEKFRTIFPDAEEAGSPPEGGAGGSPPVPGTSATSEVEAGASAEKKKRKGHGRIGADAYEGAEKIQVQHAVLKAGGPCPEAGCQGRLYPLEPSRIVRIVGQAPLGGKVWELERLRCNLCLTVYTAKAPEDLGEDKYDESAGSMVGLLRYGTGLPFNRLERLQKSFKIPLPASTQWDIAAGVAKRIAPAFRALIEEGAQGDVLYNDDTPIKILEYMKTGKRRTADDG